MFYIFHVVNAAPHGQYQQLLVFPEREVSELPAQRPHIDAGVLDFRRKAFALLEALSALQGMFQRLPRHRSQFPDSYNIGKGIQALAQKTIRLLEELGIETREKLFQILHAVDEQPNRDRQMWLYLQNLQYFKDRVISLVTLKSNEELTSQEIQKIRNHIQKKVDEVKPMKRRRGIRRGSNRWEQYPR